MKNRTIWARIVLAIFLIGLAVGIYGLYAGNTEVTNNALFFIIAGAFANYLLQRDLKKEIKEIEEDKKKQEEAEKKSAEDKRDSKSETEEK